MLPLSRITLILAIALAAAWLASGWYSLSWHSSRFTDRGTTLSAFMFYSGGMLFQSAVDRDRLSGWFPRPGWQVDRNPRAPRWQLWFKYRSGYIFGFYTGWELFVPLWAPFLAFGVLTAAIWRRRKPRPGCCPCGYSREGLVQNARCPECGRPPAGNSIPQPAPTPQ